MDNNEIKIHKTKDSEINSVYPPTTWLTFGCWIYLVPQYKPKSVLVLGYAGGTVAGLIRLLYGNDVEITGVDINDCEPNYDTKFINADAKDFVKDCQQFDCVIIDMFDSKTDSIPSFISSKEFVSDIYRIANYVCINTLKEPDLSEYDRLFKKVGVNKPTRLSNLIHYYQKIDIPNLRPYK